MTQTKLNQILEKVQSESVTLSEITEISAAILQSTSKHSNEIKDTLNKILTKLDNIESKVNYLYENNSPVFAAVYEDEKEDWKVLLFYSAVSAKLSLTLNGWSVS